MARSTQKSSPEQPKKILTAAELERALERLQARLDELNVFDINRVPDGNSPELTALSAAIRDTLERSFGLDTSAYDRFSGAATLQFRPVAIGPNYPLRQHYQEGARENIANAKALLQEAQRSLREDLADLKHVPAGPASPLQLKTPSNNVFVVHGHDEAAKQALARFLEKLELGAIVLHEQPDQGRTIIEKFEALAGEVGFAVVLLTPDDAAAATSSAAHQLRARQNVIFELGYFAGKLGRGKVCLLRKGEVEIPSDLYGVIYTELDSSDGWKMKLVKELKAAGLTFDANKVWE
jgi:predicted nucleotide-binding protein